MTDRALTDADLAELRLHSSEAEAPDYQPSICDQFDLRMIRRLLAEHAALLAVARAADELRDLISLPPETRLSTALAALPAGLLENGDG